MTIAKTTNTFELGFALADELRKGTGCDRAKAIELIENGASLDSFNLLDDMTPLMHACMHGFSDVVQAMADRKTSMNINKTGASQYTALHFAAANADHHGAACVKILASCGADINPRNASGETPLLLAIKCGAIPALAALLEANADTEMRAKEPPHITPLIAAVIADSDEMLKMLIKKQAQIEAADDDGCTPLHYAAILKSLPLVKTLITHYANSQTRTHAGDTASDIARIMDAPEIAEWIEKKIDAREKMHTTVAIPAFKKIKIQKPPSHLAKNGKKI